MIFYIIFGLICLGLLILTLKKPFWAILVLMSLLPCNAFIITYFSSILDLTENQRIVITLWKDWLIFSLLIWGAWQFINQRLKKVGLLIKLFWFDYLIVGLFLLALLTIIWGSHNLKTIIFGLRYDFEFFILYFILRIIRPTPAMIKTIFA